MSHPLSSMQNSIIIDLFLPCGEQVLINKFPKTPESPERVSEGRHQFVLHQKAVSGEQRTHAPTHTRRSGTHVHAPCTHKHTWLRNHMPYFLCNLKSPFSLLISHSLYARAHTHAHTHTQTHTHKHTHHRHTLPVCYQNILSM